MQLVDHDVAQVLEHLGPARVMWQDAAVQHVGVGEHHIRPAANGFARVLGRVTVVGERPNFSAQLVRGGLKAVELILGQSLGREQIHGPRFRLAKQQIQNRQVVAQRLATGRRRHDDGIFAGFDLLECFRLVRIKPLNPPPFQSIAQPDIDRNRNVLEGSVGRRLAPYCPHRRFGLVDEPLKFLYQGRQAGFFGARKLEHASPFLCQEYTKTAGGTRGETYGWRRTNWYRSSVAATR